MKVCIFTLGSRGDVQPYLALGQGLANAGHEAVICTGGSFRAFVESHGVSFVETPSDLMAFARTPEGKAILEHPLRNAVKGMKRSHKVLNPAYRQTLEVFFHAAMDADCIVYHPKALGAVDIAGHYGIPCVSMPPTPITYPIPELPCPALTTKNLGPRLNKMSYHINVWAETSQIDLINDFRVKTLGQKRRRAGIYTYYDGQREIPVVYPVSPLLFPEVKSWQDHVFVPGFFYLEENTASLPRDVIDFIHAGSKPIVVTFSSMPLSNPQRFLQNLNTALVETDNRAILLAGNSGICFRSNERILMLPEAPHQELFSCAKGVIHHGGAGTFAAALKAGIPQLILPFSADQPFWASRAQRLEIGPPPMREKMADKKSLISAIIDFQKEQSVKNAKTIAHAICGENGVQSAVHFLKKIVALT